MRLSGRTRPCAGNGRDFPVTPLRRVSGAQCSGCPRRSFRQRKPDPRQARCDTSAGALIFQDDSFLRHRQDRLAPSAACLFRRCLRLAAGQTLSSCLQTCLPAEKHARIGFTAAAAAACAFAAGRRLCLRPIPICFLLKANGYQFRRVRTIHVCVPSFWRSFAAMAGRRPDCRCRKNTLRLSCALRRNLC